MKKFVVLFSFVFFTAFSPLVTNGNIIDQSSFPLKDGRIIPYNNINLYDNEENQTVLLEGMLNEFNRIIAEIKQLEKNVTPENRITKFKLQSKLRGLSLLYIRLDYNDTIRPYLLKVASDLRSVGYPIADDELTKGQIANYSNFDRPVSFFDLVELAKEYPNTDYEKEALYLIVIEGRNGISLSSVGPSPFSIKDTIIKIQSAIRFIKKYPNDERVQEVKKKLDELKILYTNTPEENSQDNLIEALLQSFLNNEKVCDGEDEENGCQDAYSDFVKTWYIKKIPLSEIINSEFGYVKIDRVSDKEIQRQENAIKEHRIVFLVGKGLSRGYFSGYPDGSLGLENSVTRAELAKMLTLAFSQGTGTLSSLSKYPDRPTDTTLAPHLARLQELGIMNGYADGYIRPNQSVTIGEALKMTTRVSYPKQTFNNPKDLQGYQSFIKTTFPGLSFLSKSIDSPMTRGEVVEIIEMILEKQGK